MRRSRGDHRGGLHQEGGAVPVRALYPVLLIMVIGLIVARCPQLLFKQRFWAEEGSVLFSYAYSHSFWDVIISPPEIGYYAFLPNLSAALATVVPLEYAPFVTTYTGFFLQVIASAIVIWGNSPFWDTPLKKLVIAASIQLSSCEEIWLNSNGVQYWLCLISFLILLERGDMLLPARRLAYRALLIVAGLTGVVSDFLLPLYLYKAFRRKERETTIQAILLGIAFVFQVVVFVAASVGGNAHLQSRFGDNEFVFSRIFSLHLVLPFFGTELFRLDFFKRMEGLTAGGVPLPIVIAGGIVATVALAIACRGVRERNEYLVVAAGSFLIVTFFSIVFSIHMASSPRYVFAPGIMLVVLFVAAAGKREWRWTRPLALCLVTCFLIANTREFRERVMYSPGFPRWAEEVASWRQDSNHTLAIWPQFRSTRWSMKLERQR